MRRLIAPVLGLILLVPAGCAGQTAGSGSGSASDDGGDAVPAVTGNVTRPACPLTAAQVAEIVGRELPDTGNCSFNNGVAMVTIVTASEFAGKTTFDGQRTYAEQTYRQVKKLDKGDMAYFAVKDTGAEAAVVTKAGSYTVNLSSFIGFDATTYEQTMRKLLDTIVP
ncbi:hypothetical protein ACNTMW_02120 [Planosporangium sp. 12N6]|uniref:hypothetical protein n=1 Tax=Planosporangium spinosum TaxID=3402278 RepID=UPI003CEED43B